MLVPNIGPNARILNSFSPSFLILNLCLKSIDSHTMSACDTSIHTFYCTLWTSWLSWPSIVLVLGLIFYHLKANSLMKICYTYFSAFVISLGGIGSSLFAIVLEVLVEDSMLVLKLKENIDTHRLLILPPLV